MQGQFNLPRTHAQRRRAVAVNGHAQFGVLELQVAVHVLNFGQSAQGLLHLLGAVVKRRHVRPGQGILVERLGGTPADIDGRRHAHEYAQRRGGVQFAPQALGHALNARPLAVGLEAHEQVAVVHALAGTHNAHHGIVHGHMRLFFQQGVQGVLGRHHALKGNALLRLGAGHQKAHVLGGQKTLGHDHAQPEGQAQQAQRAVQRGQAVAQHILQGAGIGRRQSVEHALQSAVYAFMAGLVLLPGFQKIGAEHGRQRQRNHAGTENGRDDDHRELAEQTAHNAAHEQHGDEHGGQGNGHGNNGEADFRRAVIGRRERVLAHLLMTDDVFQHDNGVIHHKAHGQGQSHERKIVQAVAQHGHEREGGDDRHGQSQAGNDRGGQIAQKDEDDQHHQKNRENQGELHISHGLANGFRTVVKNVHFDRGRQLAFQAWQQRPDGVHHLHGIGAGLALHGQGDAGRAAVAPGNLLVLLFAVHHRAQVAQAHGRAVAVGHHRIPEGPRVEQLAR